MSNVLPWVHTHIIELQASGLAAACIILVLALVLLNRAANELSRSCVQRAASEPVFERLYAALSSARKHGGDELGKAREAANETEFPHEAVS